MRGVPLHPACPPSFHHASQPRNFLLVFLACNPDNDCGNFNDEMTQLAQK